jgi:hypothetical protein
MAPQSGAYENPIWTPGYAQSKCYGAERNFGLIEHNPDQSPPAMPPDLALTPTPYQIAPAEVAFFGPCLRA